eukprot:m.103047 g.103047  ORF g.103047 m.103047 type:complete len:629 (+) comp27463_c0_seq1:186-2072(+)
MAFGNTSGFQQKVLGVVALMMCALFAVQLRTVSSPATGISGEKARVAMDMDMLDSPVQNSRCIQGRQEDLGIAGVLEQFKCETKAAIDQNRFDEAIRMIKEFQAKSHFVSAHDEQSSDVSEKVAENNVQSATSETVEHAQDTRVTTSDKEIDSVKLDQADFRSPAQSVDGEKVGLDIAIISTGNTKTDVLYCDSKIVPKGFAAHSGRCPKESSAHRDEMNLQMAINHACYAKLHKITSIIDSTNYVEGMTMIPTMRNQTRKGAPVIPNSPEWKAQKAAWPDRIPVPPYWNKVHSLKKHLPDHDWLVWMDNDVSFLDMTIDIDLELLNKMPEELFMVMPFGDINCFFFIRNCPQGMKFIDRWIEMGIKDRGCHCEHKFGTWEYHDQAWWFAALIEVIQEHNDIPNPCFNDCHQDSLWGCYLNYAKKYKPRGKWPTISQALAPRKPGEIKSPVAMVETSMYRWLGRNFAWGGSGTFEEVVHTIGLHHKNPTQLSLDDDSGNLVSKCFQQQLNYCQHALQCHAEFNSAGVIKHSCKGLSSAAVPAITLDNDKSTYCEKPGCECWNCECQGLSDHVGLTHNLKSSFHGSNKRARDFWYKNHCKTFPSKDAKKNVKLKSPWNMSDCPLKTMDL